MSINLLSDEEINAFAEAARDVESERGLILRMLLQTGARVPELVALRVEDLSLAEGQVTIRNPKTRESQKLPLADPLLKELQGHVQGRDSGLVFEELGGGRHAAHPVYWLVRRTAKKAGIERRVSAHEIRHTVGRMLGERGASIEEVRAVLGASRPVLSYVQER